MNTPKPSEKLSALENGLLGTAKRVGELETLVYSLARENDMIRDAFSLLNQKMNSALELITEGLAPTDENINRKSVEMKVSNLTRLVEDFVADGRLSLSHEVTLNSFVVGRELKKDGTVANPRFQFPVKGLSEEDQLKIIGKKTGDLLEGPQDQENSLSLEITEVYDIIEAKMELSVESKNDSESSVEENSISSEPQNETEVSQQA
jgi:hypothetical protein